MSSKLDEITNKVNAMFAPYEIFAIGGSTRDTLLGKEPKDYDFTGNIAVEEVDRILHEHDRRAYLTGRRYGTTGFKLQTDDGQWNYIELTQFRKEKYTDGSRKPSVEFVDSLKDEVSRRDFSINAIAYRGGEYTDFFSGKIDLMQKKIKAVGNPKDRFTEDPLRMLRAARFTAQLDFEVDRYTEAVATRLSYRILTVSRERWVQEMDKLLLSDNPRAGLQFLARTKLLIYMLPSLSLLPRYHSEIWEDTISLVSAAPKDVDMRWACLLHAVGKPFVHSHKKLATYPRYELISTEIAQQVALYLRWSNKRTKNVIEHIPNYRLTAIN